MEFANMHRSALLKIKIVSYKDLINKEKNPNIRLDAKFFLANGDFEQRGHKGSKRKDGRAGKPINSDRKDIST
jgi:hypothetical protein